MMLLAVIGTVGFGGGFVSGSFVATALLYTWAASWATVSAISSYLALIDSIRNLCTFRLHGCTRSRFWFEIARTSCIFGVLSGVSALLIEIAELSFPVLVGEILLRTVGLCFVTFCIASAIGYFILATTRRPVIGRARQCVNFFFPQCVAAFVVFAVFIPFRNRLDDPRAYGPALVALIAICLLAALGLKLADRWKRASPSVGNVR